MGMKKYQWPLVMLLILAFAPVAEAQVFGKKTEEEKEAKAEKKRDKLDEMADKTLAKLFEESPGAEDLYNKSYGYAVFDNRKTSIVLTTGGGKGIAVERKTGDKTYMRMASAGVNLGMGLTFYQVVFLFENKDVFGNFVDKGWEVGTGADATAGETGTSAKASGTTTGDAAVAAHTSAVFSKGMAVFQFTEKGLMLQADISGTKYWKYDKLNE
jgi:lipid-binding SYLF domain-containing protein